MLADYKHYKFSCSDIIEGSDCSIVSCDTVQSCELWYCAVLWVVVGITEENAVSDFKWVWSGSSQVIQAGQHKM